MATVQISVAMLSYSKLLYQKAVWEKGASWLLNDPGRDKKNQNTLMSKKTLEGVWKQQLKKLEDKCKS